MMKFPFSRSSRQAEVNEVTAGRAKDWRDLMAVDYEDRSPAHRKRLRRERLFRVARWMLLLLLLAGAVVGGRHLFNRHVLENPDYQLVELQVETDGYLPRSHIVREAQIPEDANLLLLRLGAVRERIEALPQVESATVERQLPGVLRIQVVEYRPVAWLECETLAIEPFSSENGYLIDARGRPFPCGALRRGFMRLPIVKVRDLARVKAGTSLASAEILDALELIQKNDEILFEHQPEIRQIEPFGPYALLARYRNDAEVVFAREDLGAQLTDFGAILVFAKNAGLQIQTLDLMVRENRPITFYNDPERLRQSEPAQVATAEPATAEEPAEAPAAPSVPEAAASPAPEGLRVGEVTPAVATETGSTPAGEAVPAAIPFSGDTPFPSSPSEQADIRAILGSLY